MPSVDSRSRRRVLVAGVTALAFSTRWSAALAALLPTPEQTSGPFYPKVLPLERDADLTMLKGHTARAAGQVIHVAGRVLDDDGKPVAGATIEIWQANARGRYAHPNDTNPAPLDPNFQGYAKLTTDAEGRYAFTSIKPGAYSTGNTRRTPHIHFEVAGGHDQLTTQMYFPGEKLNASDQIYNAIPVNKEGAIAHAVAPSEGMPSDALAFAWDIVLGAQGGSGQSLM